MIAKALGALVQQGREWPPTLPEFVALCRDQMRAEAQTFVALPPATVDRIKGEQAAMKLRQMEGGVGQADPMYWAKYPKSAKAVELLVRGAERSYPLLMILRGHLDGTGQGHARSDEAVKALDWLRGNRPAWVDTEAA